MVTANSVEELSRMPLDDLYELFDDVNDELSKAQISPEDGDER